jgi:uncharacterized protein
MKFSKYNNLVQSEKYGHLLYNAHTNSFMKIDENFYKELKDYAKSGVLTKGLVEVKEELIQAKVIIEEHEEKDVLNELRYRYYLNSFNKDSLMLTVAPTIDCNFDCFYCYEDNKEQSFSEDTENDLINFIDSYEKNIALSITWYGGEPLMNFDSIERCWDRITKMGFKNISHSIITNGYLLNEKVSEYFSKNPLSTVQVTLDGSERRHDKRRKLKNGQGSYQRILKNIARFFEINANNDTQVHIRVNLDKTNLEEFPEVHNALSSISERVWVYPAFVQDNTDNCSIQSLTCGNEVRFDFYKKIYEEHKIPVNFYPSFAVGGCGATVQNSFVVGPNGDLYKCWHDIGDSTKRIGNLREQRIYNLNVLSRYMGGESQLFDSECQDCSILPVCSGKCIYYRIENNYNNKNFEICPLQGKYLKEFLEYTYEEIINQCETVS